VNCVGKCGCKQWFCIDSRPRGRAADVKEVVFRHVYKKAHVGVFGGTYATRALYTISGGHFKDHK